MQCAAFTTMLPLQGVGYMNVSQHSVQILHSECTSIKQACRAALKFAAWDWHVVPSGLYALNAINPKWLLFYIINAWDIFVMILVLS